MIVSRNWLQRYFDTPLPSAATLGDALTFHAFEMDGIEEKDGDAAIDVKVLPNRAADCFSHLGIAKELSAILNIPLKNPDPLRTMLAPMPTTESLSISVEDARACPRYIGAVIRGVKVGPSPTLLREALEAVGQRSINNVVDATNFVMLDLGQPLHAFDAAKLSADANGKYAIGVRGAKEGETMITLSDDEFALPEGALVITDANAAEGNGSAIGIAGVKGGKAAGITEATADIIVESANFDGAMVRRAMQRLKLYTDAGKRFQNNPSPELAAYAMKAVVDLIIHVAGGTLEGAVDAYPAPAEGVQIPVSAGRVNAVLGTSYESGDLAKVFDRLGLAWKRAGEDYAVDAPFERRDLRVPEDLAEEVGRIIGYETIAAVELPPLDAPADQSRFRGIERMKDQLIAEGFTEVSTQSFAAKGDIELANPLDIAKPWLRTSLEGGLADALAEARNYAPAFLPPNAKPKLFEVGTVFPKAGEFVELRMTERIPAWGDAAATTDNLSIVKLEEYGKDYEPILAPLGAYKAVSIYPFVLRDIALWAPAGTEGKDIEALIREMAGALLARVAQFDRFEKDGRVSYAFRLVFESMDRTLSDGDVNPVMEKVSAALAAKGYEVR